MSTPEPPDDPTERRAAECSTAVLGRLVAGARTAARVARSRARGRARVERSELAAGRARGARPADVEPLPSDVADRLDGFADPGAGTRLDAVINATGVIVHTNLGRAPWPRPRSSAATRAAGGYSLLELDRDAGRRGPRFRAAEEHLIALTGAEDALVTNNNAAALALAVGLAGRGRGVAVSRGELVEIGGGVRIPEIVRRAGARLIEVGTTNRTRVADFEAPLAEGRARVVLRVHPSNFRADRLHRGARRRSSSRELAHAPRRDRRRRPGLAARCSTRARSGWPTSRRRASGSPPAPTS